VIDSVVAALLASCFLTPGKIFFLLVCSGGNDSYDSYRAPHNGDEKKHLFFGGVRGASKNTEFELECRSPELSPLLCAHRAILVVKAGDRCPHFTRPPRGSTVLQYWFLRGKSQSKKPKSKKAMHCWTASLLGRYE